MSENFNVDPKLWDTLSDDQKTLMKATLAQHEQRVKNENKPDLEAEKKKWAEEQAEQTKKQTENDNFIKSAKGEANQKLVKDLLAIKSQDDIKKDYPDLFNEPKNNTDNETLSAILSAISNGNPNVAGGENPAIESDEAFIDRMNKEGSQDEKDLVRWQKVKIK